MARKSGYWEPCGAFRYYVDGSTAVDAEPDPPTPEEAKPFHVIARSEHYIPLSVLVFARDATHAKARVLAALKEAAEKYRGSVMQRAPKLLEDIASGELVLQSKPYDIKWIRAKVIWASNGGVL